MDLPDLPSWFVRVSSETFYQLISFYFHPISFLAASHQAVSLLPEMLPVALEDGFADFPMCASKSLHTAWTVHPASWMDIPLTLANNCCGGYSCLLFVYQLCYVCLDKVGGSRDIPCSAERNTSSTKCMDAKKATAQQH